jgi:outer membrane receptor protein involved in Fe transport
MKRFYIFIAIICSFITAKAQFGGAASTTVGKISGTIIDSITKKPMDYVPVSLYRSTGKSPITGVVTDEKGNFHLDGVHPGSYKISIDFMGYTSKVINPIVTTDAKPDKTLGSIVFSPSAKALKEVVIQGSVPLVENRIDKIVFNAEKDLTSAGGNATDVLQKVPLVSVDINGNVSLRGDANVRVLINGKPSGATSANLSDVLKTIPADQIKTIEVITSPSAKYDAEGTAGIINIITKNKNVSGFSGSFSGGVGTRQNNGNLNLNYSKNRFSLILNAGGNLTWPQTSLTSFNQTFFNSSNQVTQSTANSGSTYLKRYGGIGSATVNYDVNTFNSFTSTFRLNQGGFNSTGQSTNDFTNFVTPSASLLYTGHTVSHNSFGGFDWSADYTHKFKKEGNELSFSGQWSHSVINTDYTNIYSQQSANAPNQTANNDGTNNEYTLQADYVLPISKVFKLEAGGKTIFRRINSDFNLFKPATGSPGDSTSFIFDPVNSNNYFYTQNVYAGYAVFTVVLPKSYTLLIGSRLENTAITGDPINALQPALQPFTQNYDTYIPSLTIQKALTTTQTLKVTYSKRITRPSLTFLNPFLNQSNPSSESQGNPKLSPEIAQTVELNYNTYIGSSIINVSTYYRYVNGLIEGVAIPRTNGLGTITTYGNVGTNKVFGASFFGSVTPIKILTIRGSINAYTYNPSASSQFATDQTLNGTYISYNAFLSGSVTLTSGFIAEIFAVENSPRRTIQGTNPSFSLLGAGVRKQLFNKKASIGINTLEPFNKYKNFNTSISSPGFTQSSAFAFPFRSVGLTFSYTFGKLNFAPDKKKGVNNDDLKQGDPNGPGGGGASGGTGNGK